MIQRDGRLIGEQREPGRGIRLPQSAARAILALVLIVTFSAGAGVERLGLLGEDDAGATSSLTELPAFQALQGTWNSIHSQYVDESAIDDEQLIYGAASGMVEALGDTGHSRFVPEDQVAAYEEALQGELVGIGLQIEFSSRNPVILAAIDGSPASEAGLTGDDVILEVNGERTDGMSQFELSEVLRGEEGTTVDLTIERPADARTFTVTLERRRIEIEPVTWTMLPKNVALIRISQFSAETTELLVDALTSARERGATGLIVDLRDNPGGYTSQAIGVTSQFLAEGKTVFNVQERGGNVYAKSTIGHGAAVDLPMIVLINGGSASAAEIVASSLQDNGRALLVGETTYGTGTQLEHIDLGDGSLLVLGTTLWLTANGEQAWHVGIEPSIEVLQQPDVEPLRPTESGDVSAEALNTTNDLQIKRAFDELTS